MKEQFGFKMSLRLNDLVKKYQYVAADTNLPAYRVQSGKLNATAE